MQKKKVIGIIPARFESSRFAGKVLADIHGKLMVQHVWERSKKSQLLDDLIIATDDKRVEKAVRDFGAKTVMTSKNHASGTERICEAIAHLDANIAVNIQGDEPLIEPKAIDLVIQALLADELVPVATLRKKIENQDEINDPNVVKVVVDKNNFALYFSRAPIPFRAAHSQMKTFACYKHCGLYAYTKNFLSAFRDLPSSALEKIECLEQLRFLLHGYKIKVVETNYESISVDTPEDLEKVRNFLK